MAPSSSPGQRHQAGHQLGGVGRVAQRVERDAGAQVGGGRPEHVAPGEGGTGAGSW